MSDIDPDLPDYLVDALLSQQPPPDAVNLVKNSFTWRTIEAELMELSYDSVLDTAGVRDAGATRTMEFSAGETTVVVEIGTGSVRGQLTPPDASAEVQLVGSETSAVVDVGPSGAFVFGDLLAGSYRLELGIGPNRFMSPVLTVG